MKNYIINKDDLKRMKYMIELLQKAITEIIEMKKIDPYHCEPFGPHQNKFIDEEEFNKNQLLLFRKDLEDKSTIEF